MFEELLGTVAPLITRKDTKVHQSIHPGERLQFLAGTGLANHAYSYIAYMHVV